MTKDCKNDVLSFMVRVNRPYSFNDVAGAISKLHGKTSLSKAVDELVLENALDEKVNGKQRVFVVRQDSSSRPNDAELRQLDEQIHNLICTLNAIKSQVKSAAAGLKIAQSSPTLDEVLETNESIEAKIGIIHKSIKTCTIAEKVSPEEFTKVEQKKKIAVEEWRKRKRMAMEIIDTIAEGYPNSRNQLMDDVGMETDEEMGVSIVNFS